MRAAIAALGSNPPYDEKHVMRLIALMESASVCIVKAGKGLNGKRKHLFSVTFFEPGSAVGVVRMRFREVGCECHVTEAGLVPGIGITLDDASDTNLIPLAARRLDIPAGLMRDAFLAIGTTMMRNKNTWPKEGLLNRVYEENAL
jgi:hypothetical protein